MVNIIKNGKAVDLKAISGKVGVSNGDKIVITDSINGQSSQKLITKKVGNDLVILEEGSTEPLATLESYYEGPGVELSGMDASGESFPYVTNESYNGFELLSGPLEAPAAGETVAATSAVGGGTTTGLSTMSMVGLGGLGVAGATAVAVGSQGGEESSSPSTPVVPNTIVFSATILIGDTALKAGETTSVFVIFSKAVSNFSNADLSIANGTLSTLATTDNITWTATFTPDTNIEDTTNIITLANTYTDSAGNIGTSASSSNYVIDTLAPIITSSTISTNINENSGAGQLIYTVTATDGNSIAYSLSGADALLLNINSSTGEVTLNANPDYETKNNYNFTVIATDGAGNTSEQVVSLAINNLDEIAPTITSSTIATTINENSGAGQIIYTVTSTDTADISTGFTAYSLKNTGDYNLLNINSTTGEITLNANPDYETKSSYVFTVIATDNAGNVSEKAVSLAINNLDEIAPIVPTLTLATDSGTINGDERTNVSTININGVEVGATWEYRVDFGTWINGSGTSFIALEGGHDYQARQTDGSGNISNIFADFFVTLDTSAPIAPSLTLATDSGSNTTDRITNISTINTLGLEGMLMWEYSIDGGSWLSGSGNSFNAISGTHSYAARQSDQSGNMSTQSSSVTITLDNTAPLFTSTSTVSIDENISTSTIIYDALANDINTVTYSLFGGYDVNMFNINTTTGEVTFKTSPDYETPSDNGTDNVYDYTIRATDVAGNTTDKAVQVSVNNLTESTTAVTATILIGDTALKGGETASVFIVFNKAVSNFSNSDLTIANGTLSLLTTTDNILWTATFTPDTAIEDMTNIITLANTYTDSLGNTGTSTVSGNYSIDTIAPVFTSVTTQSIQENIATTIYIANASGAVSYTLSGEDASLFILDTSSGALRFSTPADYENPIDMEHNNTYHLLLNATDSAGNTTSQNVKITVTDVDDIAPVFTSATSVSVIENTSTVVYTAIATDVNSITYAISGTDAALFNLNSSTGAVTFKTSPDYEVPNDSGNNNIYNFSIRATDTGGNYTDQSVTLAVTNSSEITLGQGVIDLGGYGKLIAPYFAAGNWYYFWDVSGDGNADYNDGVTSHDFLDGLFTKNSAGETGGFGNTDNTYRYATLNGINVALPTIGDGTTYLFYDRTVVNHSTDYAAIFNSYVPSGWINDYYWTSTPSSYGHSYIDTYGYSGAADNYNSGMFVALQVLG